ncbi:lectin-like domain-containing protein [Ornithinibacillus bavariensis]|uniref:Uncharacterized protein n=1 Tax=Ornithinibacillus bavariensis TaxID=545502 RepID=A0A919X9M3_9BACI|nr:Ig-like domain-containing protein [Ornithinibacillus bavariensis]GIO27398.1 hypothetical protein J43TS3_20090 [Ornithinibacillus bavariensis]
MKLYKMKNTGNRLLAIMLSITLIFSSFMTTGISIKAESNTSSTMNWLTYKFDINDFSEPSLQELFQLNGLASFADGRLIINPRATPHQTGSAFNKQSFQPHEEFSFSTGFSFEMNANVANSADGMSFAIVNDLEGLGSTGGGLGIEGITPSFALKFDTYYNAANGDPSNNYIGIALNGNLINENASWYKNLNDPDLKDDSGKTKFVLKDGKTYFTWIDYDGASNNMKVYFNDSASKPSNPIIDAAGIDLKNIFDGTDAIYTGFTGVGWDESHEIISWYFVNEYAPIGDLDDTAQFKQAPSSIEMVVDETSEKGKFKVSVTAKNADKSIAAGVPIEMTSSKNGVWKDLDGNVITDWSTMLTDSNGQLEVYFIPNDPFTSTDIRAVAVGGAIATDEAPAVPRGPGGVIDGLSSWVDVGKSSVRDASDRVIEMEDLAFDRIWSVVGTNAQPYNASTINFNPGITIDSSVGYYSTTNFGQNDTSREIFSVQSSSNYTGFPWEFGSNSQGPRYGLNNGSQISTSFFSTSNRTVNIPEKYDLLKSRVLNIRSSSEEWSLSLDGNQLESFDENVVKWSNSELGTYYIGAGHHSRFNGSISEVILYNRVLTSIERQQVNSYLALKYGLTLPTDYLDSSEGILWTEADNADYSNRITGIGRDDFGGLYQKQSVSQENGANVTIALGDAVANSNEENENMIWNNKSYFVFGDNGASTEFIDPADKNDENLKRMERVYKVQKTNWQDTNANGEDSKITLQIEKVEGAEEWPLYVIVSSDEQFDGEDSFYLIEDGKVTIDTKAFGPVSYFTIAATVPQFEGGALEETETGNVRIALNFDNEIDLTSLDGFTITIDGEEVAINEINFEVDPNNRKQLYLLLPEGTAVHEKEVKVIYDGNGNVKGTNGVPVDGFEQVVINEFASALQITEPSNELVNTSKPTITGTAIPDATVSIVIKDSEGNVVEGAGGTTTVDEDGTWYFTPAVELPDGLYTIEATATKDGRTATKTKEFTIVDKTKLESKVEEIEASNLREEDYTEESWQELQSKLKEAQGVLEDPNATSEDVKEALEKLEQAYEALTRWVPEVETAEVNELDKIELTFDKPIDLDNLNGFTVEVNGQLVVVTDFEVDGEKLTLRLPESVEGGSIVKVTYDEDSGNLRGTNGEPVKSFDKELTVVDKTALEAKVGEVITENLIEEDYTQESWQELQSKLQVAKEVLADPNASQEEVNNAFEELQEALDSLTLRIELTEPIDKTIHIDKPTFKGTATPGSTVTIELTDSDGNKVTKTVITDVDGNWEYTPTESLENGTYTIAVSAEKDGKKSEVITKEFTIEKVDKSALEAEINLRETLNEKDYSTDSWEAYETALTNAKLVFDNPKATQSEVDAALKTLEDARLKLTVDKSALQAKVKEADRLVESHYSKDSWAAYQKALERAAIVLADPNATQSLLNWRS